MRLQCHSNYIQWYYAVLDSIESKTYEPDPHKIKRKQTENICHGMFSNKAIEMINLSAPFNSTTVESSLSPINAVL